jgi:tripartite-type tricarboxylate transporter receptor subunit TctC
MVAPPKMPTALADRISRDVAEVLQRPDVSGRLRELMLDPLGGTPAEVGRFFAEEAAVWGKVIQENNLSAQ